jgi:hypothetical protein
MQAGPYVAGSAEEQLASVGPPGGEGLADEQPTAVTVGQYGRPVQ